MSSPKSPPAKRQRMEDASITRENADIARSKTWRSDGNVILQAGNTQFRVHWSVLALHSPVFRDMQGLPQPPDEPTVDGCPIVNLSDNPDDVEYLLKVLYNPTFLSEKKLSLAVVGALIRLGRKYDFKDLFDWAVGRLTSRFPTTLDEFDAVKPDGLSIERYPGIHFDIAALASENGILTLLPSVYYWLVSTNSMASLIDGIERGDGTMAHLPNLDMRRCAVGQQRLLTRQFLPGHTLGASKYGEGLITRLSANLDVKALMSPALVLKIHPFCANCTQHALQYTTTARKKMWETLPAIFDLPPWNELKNGI
ncbi:BTB domain-containing protein [Mycena sanguinolenta]|uniref:BTB domain-containing protein n=1 Tax=Mycena sanguinolenta TaxID=230812 RepID=A0A8H6Z4F5_9AGAR|nr:BTB domain-containing protein [Mycena sanguinolenta]